jgi:hypothetical protein
MSQELAANVLTVQCAACRQAFALDGDAAEIVAARLAAGGAVRCLGDGCGGLCLQA